MAVIKEYKCLDCTRIFDSSIPSCVHCGSENIQRIFVTPFSFKSDKTKFSDDNLEHLTSSYKLSDFSNNESTKHEPDRSGNWADLSGSDVKGLLPQVAGGSVNVAGIGKTAMPRIDITAHKDDKL